MTTTMGQELQSLDIKDYKYVIIVGGSRNWNDRRLFDKILKDYVSNFDSPILFVSGAAPSGADELIIRWCRYYRYPCLSMPADWDNLQKRAGFVRNEAMAKIATHYLSFYNGTSPGTAHMLEMAEKYNLITKTVEISNVKTPASYKSISVSGCAV